MFCGVSVPSGLNPESGVAIFLKLKNARVVRNQGSVSDRFPFESKTSTDKAKITSRVSKPETPIEQQ